MFDCLDLRGCLRLFDDLQSPSDFAQFSFDFVFIDHCRIVLAEPRFGILMVWVLWVGERVEGLIEAQDAAAVVWRRISFAAEIKRVCQAGISGLWV